MNLVILEFCILRQLFYNDNNVYEFVQNFVCLNDKGQLLCVLIFNLMIKNFLDVIFVIKYMCIMYCVRFNLFIILNGYNICV